MTKTIQIISINLLLRAIACLLLPFHVLLNFVKYLCNLPMLQSKWLHGDAPEFLPITQNS